MKESAYERFIKHSSTLIAIGLSGIALISLITYRLLYPVSDDLNQKLSYAELALSLVTSSRILVYTGILFMILLIALARGSVFNGMFLIFMIYALVGLLLNPFVLSGLRVLLQDKINDTLISLTIVASTVITLVYTSAMFLRKKA